MGIQIPNFSRRGDEIETKVSKMAKKKSYGNHAPSSCGGAYVCEFTEDNLPYLKCSLCDHRVEDWIRWHRQYKDLWQQEDSWADAKNNIAVLLGYFCDKFRTTYRTEFALSYTENGLFRGTEATFIRRLLAMFNNSNLEVRGYIDWYFEYKVERQGKKLVSMTALVAPAVIGLYKHHSAKKSQITRSTPIPEKMLTWIKENLPDLLTLSELNDFGDLQKLLAYAKQNPGKSPALEQYVQELYRRKLIDNDLNIQGML